MTQQACIVSNLSLELAQHKIFDQLSFQLPLNQFCGLIGRNGQGKSLLMSLLQGQSTELAYSGQINWQCPHQHLAQLQRVQAHTIAQVLDIEDLYQCFERIQQGTASFSDYDQVEQLWHLPVSYTHLRAHET